MLMRFLRNYAARHQHPANQLLHAIGLPVTFLLPPLWLWQGHPWAAVGGVLMGYALQFLGHAIEGNDAGEVILVKKSLGIKVIEIASHADYMNQSSREQ
jgi:uncharacterized membrane protein YGL010W